MDEAKPEAMIDVTAPIPLTRAALPVLRDSGDAMVVNVFLRYRTGRRELKREGIHVSTVYPDETDMPMIKSNCAGPELGFSREPPSTPATA
jgi:uncharacterized oxidoreductase